MGGVAPPSSRSHCVGFGLRVAVARQDLFADELSTYWIVANNDLDGVISVVNSDAEITPPLSFVARLADTQMRAVARVLRVPSLLAGTLTIPAVYWLGMRTVGRPRAWWRRRSRRSRRS